MRTISSSAAHPRSASHETIGVVMEEPDILSIHRSFIVRFYPSADPDEREISGRVEHVISGEAGEFRSVEDLLRFMGHLLRREDSGPES